MTDQLPATVREHSGAAAVCDPRLPASFCGWALRQRASFDTRGNLLALTPGGSSRGVRPAAAVSGVLAMACAVLVFGSDPASLTWVAWLAAALAAAVSAATIQFRASGNDLRLAHRRVIYPGSLDGPAQVLLGRTQGAIGTVLGSRVRAEGLLGHHVDDALLREREWEIAGKLREITELRALLTANTASSLAGPMTSDVLGRQRRALELARDGTESLIRALERYADQIVAADAAELDWQQASRLARLNDKYLDLVARTASDDYARQEIAGLTEQLAAAARIRQERLYDADLAARALELPSRPAPDPDEEQGN